MIFNQPIALKELLDIIGHHVEVQGDSNAMVSGINEIHMVQPGEITFVDHPKYYEKVLKSQASFIILDIHPENSYGKTIIISDDPFRDYVKLVKHFRQFHAQDVFVHPGAQIGEGTILQPGVFVGENVKIGKNCIIHSNVSIYDHTTIGDNVIIQSNSVIGGEAFYFKRRPTHWDKLESCGSTTIDDNVEIGALCAIDKGVSGDTHIGEGCKFDNHVQVGHDTTIGKHCLIGSHCAIAGVTTIEDDCLIWGRVSINKDLVIGKGSVILATSGVDKSVPAGKVMFGSPAVEVNKKWKELAALRMLPQYLEKINDIEKYIEDLQSQRS
ncbi:MAG: UDP-3-O-(3-hydroxymyristoyl)glucosamine N-acyltransferase [Bacteroidales bacterium]|nr:UDP-3-O-(3-hydroxymyristoyl)glucosamine N-acyltransferase [Bacteroidales bacterium]